MDDITAPTPSAATTGAPAANEHQKAVMDTEERLSSENTIESLELSEDLPIRSKLRNYIILVALALELFIAALDQTIVSTSAPSIAADLHNAVGYTWIAGAYLLASAATGLIWVKCSNIWGRKLVILVSIATFAAATVVTALSTSMAMLIAGRAMQGIAAGGVMQLVNITISDIFSIRQRALYLSSMGMVWVLAGTSGPLIGGALSEYASWRWCFWINLPVCGITFVVILLFLDVHNPRTKLGDGLKAIDWFGTVSMLAVTLLILLGLDFGGVTFPWNSPKVICLIVFGTVMIGFFFYSEKRLAKYPLMFLGVFKGWSNNAIAILIFSQSIVSFGAEYYLPLYFQSVKQASPLQSGLLILPMIITSAIMDVLTGIYMHQIGRYREPIWAGSLLMTLGSGLYIMLGTDTTLGTLFGFQIVFGIGISLLFQTPTIALQNNVSQANTASATATLSFIRSLGATLSTVIGQLVFQNSMAAQASSLAASGLSKSELDALTGSQAAANVGIIGSIDNPTQRRAVEDAYAWSIRNMFIMYTCIAAVGLVASAFIKQRHMSTEHTETKTGIQNMEEQRKG